MKKPWPPALFALLISFLAPGVIAATVTNCDEASLRGTLAGGGTVNFACDGTIVLTSTITINNNTVLDATGHHVLISGGNLVRVFSVNSGVQFTMFGVTVANGGGGVGG